MEDQKKKFISFFGVYFMTQLMYIYINAYLPIYFTYASGIYLPKLGIILFISFLFLFTKPLLSIYFDWTSKKEGKQNKFLNKKIFLILGAAGALISFIILLLSVELLFIFMLILGTNLAFISLMDVSIDKIILKNSNDEISKNKNAFYLQFGAIIGAIVPNIYYFFLVDRTIASSWTIFFMAGITTLIVTFPVILILKENDIKTETHDQINISNVPTNIKNVMLMSIFIFLTFGTYIYDWILEPWAVGKLGSDSIFALVMTIFIIFDVIGLILAVKYIQKYNKKRILMISALGSGVLTAFAPFLGIFVFVFLIIIVQIIAGFYNITYTFLMFEISQKKVLIFQIMSVFTILAKLLLSPLGLILSEYILVEIIIMIAGILQIFSVLPLIFIK